MQKCDLDLVLIAGRYTLLDQEAQNELFPLAIEKKISVLAAGVYNSGILANPISGARYDYAPATPEILAKAVKIQAFLRERNVSLTAAAIQFPLQHPAVTAVIAGARNKAELQENIKDFNSDIPLTVWEDLRSARLIS
jgi:D-threo-aldose 1-dehydrogenase